MIIFSPNGKSSYKTTSFYDEKGNLIEHNTYDSKGTLQNKDTYEYNEKNTLTEFNSYDSTGNLKFIIEGKYEYDKYGNVIKCIQFEDGKPIKIYENNYVYYD
jgi:hypothetical protein